MTGAIDFAKPPTTRHKVTLKFDVKQDGQPFMDQVTNYQNCGDQHVAAITGLAVDMAGGLGTQGQKPAKDSFAIKMDLLVDDKPAATGSWDGLSREQAENFERHVLNIWLHGNEQTAVANAAAGKTQRGKK